MTKRWFDADIADPQQALQNLKYKIGIEYDESLINEFPFINDSNEHNNQGICSVMYQEFDDRDPELKVVSLSCGHQFSACSWAELLKKKVKEEGKDCVWTKCP